MLTPLDPFPPPQGKGNYCPPGSAAPIACPIRVSALGPNNAQGPAFLVDVAQCLGQCFFPAQANGTITSGC